MGTLRPPIVSVVMPVYNGKTTLRRAIDSILAQSLQEIELIVVNDGSTDGTAEILDSIDDDRLKVVAQANQGIVRALNTGISLAQAKFIARADADDWYHPARLAKQLAWMLAQPSCILCYTDFDMVYMDGTVLAGPRGGEDADFKEKIFASNFVMHSSVMFRVDAVRNAGGYLEEWKGVEDWALWLRLSDVGRISRIPETLSYLNVHNSSYSAVNEIKQSLLGVKLRLSLIIDGQFPLKHLRHFSRPIAKVLLGARMLSTFRRLVRKRRYE